MYPEEREKGFCKIENPSQTARVGSSMIWQDSSNVSVNYLWEVYRQEVGLHRHGAAVYRRGGACRHHAVVYLHHAEGRGDDDHDVPSSFFP